MSNILTIMPSEKNIMRVFGFFYRSNLVYACNRTFTFFLSLLKHQFYSYSPMLKHFSDDITKGHYKIWNKLVLDYRKLLSQRTYDLIGSINWKNDSIAEDL